MSPSPDSASTSARVAIAPVERRVQLFGMGIDAIDMATAVDRVFEWIRSGDGRCRFVVTPNGDHAVLYQEHIALRQAYEQASLVLADGVSMLISARLLGRPLPGRVPGADLVPALFAEAANRGGIRVFLLGAATGVAEAAALKIQATWPAVTVVGTYSPPKGFEQDAAENENILLRVATARADLLVVGFGAPKQETWVCNNVRRIDARVALCVGATIDFLAGEKRRAPPWMRRMGLEWLYRLIAEPSRMGRRYGRDAVIMPRLLWRELCRDREVGSP